MSVQFLVNGIHEDGSPGLVAVSEKEWQEIIEQNASLPKEKRRYFYRDLIFDGKEKDYIIMEVPKTTLRKWNNQDNGHYRNLSFQKNYTFLSLDTLIQEGSSDLVSDVSIEEHAIANITIDELRTSLKSKQIWMIDLLELYLAGEEKTAIQFLMDQYKFGRSTAFYNKQRFEIYVKNFF